MFIYQPPVLEQHKLEPITFIKIEEKRAEAPKEILYTIKEGDNLTKISEAHSVPVSRLWAANTELTSPDVIEPNKTLKIPKNEDVLPERPLPVTAPPEIAVTPGPTKIRTNSTYTATKRSGKSTPGWYYVGQCTGWVASKRFVPDGWGNASDWKWHAQAEGWTVSSEPVAGAIGWTSGHVVYVESVNGDSVTISEQNYDWNGSIRTITVPKSKYTYLY